MKISRKSITPFFLIDDSKYKKAFQKIYGASGKYLLFINCDRHARLGQFPLAYNQRATRKQGSKLYCSGWGLVVFLYPPHISWLGYT